MPVHFPSRRQWALWFWLLAAIVANSAWAACSTINTASSPRISVNEYNLIDSNTATGKPYVEIKVIDPTIIAATSNFNGWKLKSFRKSGGSVETAEKDLKDVFTSSDYADKDYCKQTAGANTYIRVRFENADLQDDAAVVLSDNNNNIVDLLRVTKSNASYLTTIDTWYPSSYNSCTISTLPLDTSIYGIDANRKNIQRLPDGTGNWTQAPGNGSNSEDSLCTTNDNILLLTKTPLTTTYNSYSPGLNGTAQYSITVRNGAASASQSGITVTENLSGTGLTYSSHSTANGTATYSAGSQTLTWNVGTLAAGVTASLTLTVTATTTNLIANTITATSTELAGGYTQATAYANALLVTLVPDTTTPSVGGQVSYTVSVKNQMTTNLSSVATALPLPAGMSYVSNTSPSQGSFVSGSMNWSIGTLAAGTTATMTLTVSPGSAGDYTYTGTATTTSIAGSYTGSATVTAAGAPASFVLNVPDFKAGDGTASAATITAQKADGTAQTGFANTTRKIKFYYQAVNPATGASGTMKMDAWEAATNTTASVGSVATTLATAVVRDVYFDANGIGRFDLNYDNVGEFKMLADWLPSYETTPPAGAPTAMSGDDNFIVTPYRYDVVPSVTAAAGGSTFDLTVTAQALCGKAGWGYTCPSGQSYTTASNFAGTAAGDVNLGVAAGSLSNVPNLWCSPAVTGCTADAASGAYLPAASFTGGVATLSGAHWSEVGTATFTAAAAYLGTASQTSTGNATNFHPARFGASGSVTAPGGTWIYMGQNALNVAETIAAEVAQPDGSYATAKNYAAGAYGGTLAAVQFQAKSAGSDVYVCKDNSVACSATATNLLTNTTCTWSLGLCTFLHSSAVIERPASAISPQATTFTVQITDTENLVALCSNTSTSATLTPKCTVTDNPTNNLIAMDFGPISARYGRVALQNAFGSEMLDLEVRATAQYYDSGVWKTNTLDSSTQFLTTASGTGSAAYVPTGITSATTACYGVCSGAASVNTAGLPVDYGGSLVLDNVKNTSTGSAAALTAASSVPSYAAHAPDSTTFASGVLNLNLGHPGPSTGSFDLTMTVPPWLQVGGTNPKANVTFGIYRGNKKIIYRREVR